MDKFNANVKAASGAVKENVGSAIGNEQMQLKARPEEPKGMPSTKRPRQKGMLRVPARSSRAMSRTLLVCHWQRANGSRRKGWPCQGRSPDGSQFEL
ncbi:hypothetical protein K493DRAFT_312350, partial [Basidiobolus meristosporus CBS 931.73]